MLEYLLGTSQLIWCNLSVKNLPICLLSSHRIGREELVNSLVLHMLVIHTTYRLLIYIELACPSLSLALIPLHSITDDLHGSLCKPILLMTC